MLQKYIHTDKYAKRSIEEMARDLAVTVARSPDAYIPISEFPTLEFEVPKRNGYWALLALALFLVVASAAYFTRRPSIIAAPDCNPRKMECGR